MPMTQGYQVLPLPSLKCSPSTYISDLKEDYCLKQWIHERYLSKFHNYQNPKDTFAPIKFYSVGCKGGESAAPVDLIHLVSIESS